MGWTYRETSNIEQARADHVWNATRYSAPINAEMIAFEWHPKTFFAIIRLTGGKYETPKTFLTVDFIDASGGQFGYKDGCEEMGMYCDNKTSREFAELIYKHIPNATGYAKDFRDRMGIKYRD